MPRSNANLDVVSESLKAFLEHLLANVVQLAAADQRQPRLTDRKARGRLALCEPQLLDGLLNANGKLGFRDVAGIKKLPNYREGSSG